MKKNLIKKVFAVSLSIAMACSFLPAANPVTASAAAPYVGLKTPFKTLKVGQKYKMTLKNNTLGWKIIAVKSDAKAIANAYGKTTTSVKVKAKSEGKAKFAVTLKTNQRKANNKKTLKFVVKVVSANPSNPDTPIVQTEATVATQAQLDEALADNNITKITIKTEEETKFVIQPGTFSNVDLIVDAPKADVENNATFNSITINDIKGETWTEKAKGNKFSVLAANASIIVDKDAEVSSISCATANAAIKLTINGGTVGTVTLTQKAKLNIFGTSKDNAKVNVVVDTAAADSELTTEVPAAVTTKVKIIATFEKTATGSTIKIEVAGITVNVTNRTDDVIPVTDQNNNTTRINKGAIGQSITSPNTNGGTTYPGTSGSGSGSSSGSSNKPASTFAIVTGQSVEISNAQVTFVTGSATYVSDASLTITVRGIPTSVSASAIECMPIIKDKDNKTISIGSYTKCTVAGSNSHEIWYEINLKAPVKGNLANGFTLILNFRVAETTLTGPGPVSPLYIGVGGFDLSKNTAQDVTTTQSWESQNIGTSAN